MLIYAASPIDSLSLAQKRNLCSMALNWLEKHYPKDKIYFPLQNHLKSTGPAQRHFSAGRFDLVQENDVRNLEDCDVIVAFHPRLSLGTHFELGYVSSANKWREKQTKIHVVEFNGFNKGPRSVMISNLPVETVPL